MSLDDNGASVVASGQENEPWNDAAILTAFDSAVKSYGRYSDNGDMGYDVGQPQPADDQDTQHITQYIESNVSERGQATTLPAERGLEVVEANGSLLSAEKELEKSTLRDPEEGIEETAVVRRKREKNKSGGKAKKRKVSERREPSGRRTEAGIGDIVAQGMPPFPPLSTTSGPVQDAMDEALQGMLSSWYHTGFYWGRYSTLREQQSQENQS